MNGNNQISLNNWASPSIKELHATTHVGRYKAITEPATKPVQPTQFNYQTFTQTFFSSHFLTQKGTIIILSLFFFFFVAKCVLLCFVFFYPFLFFSFFKWRRFTNEASSRFTTTLAINHFAAFKSFITPPFTLLLFRLWQTVWPDLTKFQHFGKIFQAFGNILRVYLVLDKIVKLLW